MNVLSYLNEVAPMPRNISLTASFFLPPFFFLWIYEYAFSFISAFYALHQESFEN